jgi:hypothetical protein
MCVFEVFSSTFIFLENCRVEIYRSMPVSERLVENKSMAITDVVRPLPHPLNYHSTFLRILTSHCHIRSDMRTSTSFISPLFC